MSEKKYIDAGAWLARVNPSWMYTNLARKIIREAPAASGWRLCRAGHAVQRSRPAVQ